MAKEGKADRMVESVDFVEMIELAEQSELLQVRRIQTDDRKAEFHLETLKIVPW